MVPETWWRQRISQMKALKSEVEHRSIRGAVGHGLCHPKRQCGTHSSHTFLGWHTRSTDALNPSSSPAPVVWACGSVSFFLGTLFYGFFLYADLAIRDEPNTSDPSDNSLDLFLAVGNLETRGAPNTQTTKHTPALNCRLNCRPPGIYYSIQRLN